MNLSPREADASLHTSLLSAMLGASIGFAIQSGFQKPEPLRIIAILALVLHAVNFYHAKLVRLYDRLEQLTASARPTLRGGFLLSNTLLFMTFCVMALRIDSVGIICVGEMCLRVIDSVLIMAQLRVGDRSPGKRVLDKSFRSQLHYWLGMNVLCFLAFLTVFILSLHLRPTMAYTVTVAALVLLVAVDLVIEYGVYSANYFNELSDWDRLAERWDRLQGKWGDKYRQEIIHPFLLTWIRHLRNKNGCVVVDIGCGNGCTSRFLAEMVGKSSRLISRRGL